MLHRWQEMRYYPKVLLYSCMQLYQITSPNADRIFKKIFHQKHYCYKYIHLTTFFPGQPR